MNDSDPIARPNAALEGRYATRREFGEGGMAAVSLADDLLHEQKAPLKCRCEHWFSGLAR